MISVKNANFILPHFLHYLYHVLYFLVVLLLHNSVNMHAAVYFTSVTL